MGVRLAKAMSPKPSTIGLRPLIEVASPTPSAVTSGTVTRSLRNAPEAAYTLCSDGAGTAKPSSQWHRLRRTELRSVRCASALTSVISGVSPMGYSVAMGPAALSAPYSRSS